MMEASVQLADAKGWVRLAQWDNQQAWEVLFSTGFADVTISGLQGRGTRLRTEASPQAHQWCSDRTTPVFTAAAHGVAMPHIPRSPSVGSSCHDCSLSEGLKPNTLTSIHFLSILCLECTAETHSDTPTKALLDITALGSPLSPPSASHTQAHHSDTS